MHPILFQFGPVRIYSYGVCAALGFIIVAYLILRDSPKYSISKDNLWDMLFYILISGIVGARLLHVLLNLGFYIKDPIKIVMIHRGGLAMQGAIFAATLAGILFVLKKGLPLWKTGDLFMQYVALGHSIGRIGCFLNGCCYGKDGIPTQVYSAVGLLIIYAVLRYISLKRRRFDGEVFLLYFILYSAFRYFMDFFRGDLSRVWFSLTASQLISIAIFITAAVIFNEKYRDYSQR